MSKPPYYENTPLQREDMKEAERRQKRQREQEAERVRKMGEEKGRPKK